MVKNRIPALPTVSWIDFGNTVKSFWIKYVSLLAVLNRAGVACIPGAD